MNQTINNHKFAVAFLNNVNNEVKELPKDVNPVDFHIKASQVEHAKALVDLLDAELRSQNIAYSDGKYYRLGAPTEIKDEETEPEEAGAQSVAKQQAVPDEPSGTK